MLFLIVGGALVVIGAPILSIAYCEGDGLNALSGYFAVLVGIIVALSDSMFPTL